MLFWKLAGAASVCQDRRGEIMKTALLISFALTALLRGSIAMPNEVETDSCLLINREFRLLDSKQYQEHNLSEYTLTVAELSNFHVIKGLHLNWHQALLADDDFEVLLISPAGTRVLSLLIDPEASLKKDYSFSYGNYRGLQEQVPALSQIRMLEPQWPLPHAEEDDPFMPAAALSFLQGETSTGIWRLKVLSSKNDFDSSFSPASLQILSCLAEKSGVDMSPDNNSSLSEI